MINEQKILATEFTAIILLWTLVVVSPLLFMDDLNQNWRAVHVMWAECMVVGFAFLVNRFVLMPRLFFEKQYALYAISLSIIFLLLGVFVLHFDGVNILIQLFGESPTERLDMPPMEGMPPHDMIPPQRPHPMGMQRVATPPNITVIPPMISVLTLSALVIALDIGLSITVKWLIAEQRQTHNDKERVAAQLSNLQSQVSPHFFMNTLNNIHALVDIDSERAKQTIIELSGLMNYLLYESSSHSKVSLSREIDFINSYINLMRLRFPELVKIDFICDENVPSVKIPPLLFLNFIENAFKYGVDYEQESFIKIKFEFSNTSIAMIALNSNHADSVKSHRHGLGISNCRGRLELLYDDRYTLDISDKEKIFYVNLKIPIE